MKELPTDVVLALHALHLLMNRGDAVSIREIQKYSRVAPARLPSILEKLLEGGLIQTYSGGRVVLAKAPGEISIKHVLDAVSGLKRPAAPCGGDFEACSTRATCILAPLCQEADRAYQDALRSFTLADLAGVPPDIPNCLDLNVRTN